MEGLGISAVGTSSKAGKRTNGDAKQKGKQQVEPPTTYTVSKIDAGQAVLISDQIHCIEFPSILLPAGCTTGSVISISCTRNQKEERKRNDEFWDLQDEILAAFGERSPAPPRLRLRNVTQTSVTLEWDKLDLATSKLLSLTIWRNGQRLAAIPNPLNNTSTKVSGLDVDAPYSFHLIMRTTAGTYASQTIKTRTLTLADTSGIAVCFGAIDSSDLVDEAKEALTQMRARWSNRIQIETTHFVCTHASGPPPAVTPPSDSPQETPNPGAEYQRAQQLSIPVVQPAWVLACLREKRMVPISAYTLDKAPISGGPSSSASLAKNASAKAEHRPAQQPRDGPREPVQLQKPPPPRKTAEVPPTPLPETEELQQSAADIVAPTNVELAPTVLPEVEESEPQLTDADASEPEVTDPEALQPSAVGIVAPTNVELAPTVLPEVDAPEPQQPNADALEPEVPDTEALQPSAADIVAPTSVELAPTVLPEGDASDPQVADTDGPDVTNTDVSEPEAASAGEETDGQAGTQRETHEPSKTQVLDTVSEVKKEDVSKEPEDSAMEESLPAVSTSGGLMESHRPTDSEAEAQELGEEVSEDTEQKNAFNPTVKGTDLAKDAEGEGEEGAEDVEVAQIATPAAEGFATVESGGTEKDAQNSDEEALGNTTSAKTGSQGEDDASSDKLEEVKL